MDHLRHCIRLNLDVVTTGGPASRRTGLDVEVIRAVVRASETACRTCAEAREG